MNSSEAITRLLALGQPTRLAAYRLLIEHEPTGLCVGEIARKLDVNVSTLSRHLGQLERTGLLQSWRSERQVFYRCSDSGLDDLMKFLTENCCQSTPGECDDAPKA